MKIALIVVTTCDEYSLQINNLRRKQREKYKIPILFVYNGNRPNNYEAKPDEIHCEIQGVNGQNPIMLAKFIIAINHFEKHYNISPTYYVRTNTSCFVNLKKLPIVLRYLPVTNCNAGRFDSKYNNQLFCNGTCMIISNDVAKKLAQENIFSNQMTFIENDDVSISWLGLKYAILLDLSYWFSIFEGLTSLPTVLPTEPSHIVFYRIKNLADRKTIDVGLWKMLEDKCLM